MSELMEHPVYKEQSLLTLWDGHLVRVLGEVHRLLMLAQDKADRTD
ncbi:hypothetical protein [Ferrimonas marina]|nr:hypothetical protein [Ferrimonas marina]